MLPESPRWLLQKGRWSEAEKELNKAARWNGSKTFDSAWLLTALTQMKAQVREGEGSGRKNKSGRRKEEKIARLTLFIVISVAI